MSGGDVVDLWGERVPLPSECVVDADARRRERAREVAHQRVLAGNPLRRRFGPGPDGATCKTCVHLFAKRYAGTYYKCALRGDTNGPGTDHRVRWPSCGKYDGTYEANVAVSAGGG